MSTPGASSILSHAGAPGQAVVCLKCRNSGLLDPLRWPDEPGYSVCACPAGQHLVAEFAREMSAPNTT